MKRRKGWRMSCDVGEVMERLEHELHSPIFSSLHLRHSLFSNPSVASTMSQLIPQPFCCFTYVTTHSSTFLLLLLCHWLFTYITWMYQLGCHARVRSLNTILRWVDSLCTTGSKLKKKPPGRPKTIRMPVNVESVRQ